MAQLFTKKANIVPIYVLIALILLIIIIIGAFWYWGSPYYTDVGYQPEQPVPYSHKFHVGELGMDCRYCHTGVEMSAVAGIPPTQTCMNCHVMVKPASDSLKVVKYSWDNNKPIQCSQTKKLANSIGGTDIHIRNFCEPKIQEKNIVLKYARKVRIMGSSALEICLVADGSLDFYIDFRGISRICDFAAAYLIVKEAGGFFINDKGRAISKATNKFSLDKRYNLLAGCPGLKEIVKKKFISR